MRATVCKVFRFEAAHHLPNHDGKCRQPHGHSYKVEVFCAGRIQTVGPKSGMVVDFSEIKSVWNETIKPLVDHQDLNKSLSGIPGTTAECIAAFLVTTFHQAGVPVTAVTVWETETSSATVTHSEVWANGD